MENKEENKIKVILNSEKTTPKYATNVAISKLSNGSVIFTFIFKMPPFDAEIEDSEQPGNVIETIMIDESHAKKMLGALDDAIKSNFKKNG